MTTRKSQPSWSPIETLDPGVLQANLSSLEKRFPEAGAVVRAADLSEFLHETTAPDRSRIARQEGADLRQVAGDDWEEASLAQVREELSKRIEEKTIRIYVLAGFGCGRAAQQVAEDVFGTNAGVLVLEPDASLFRAALSLKDFRPLLEHGKFFFAVGDTLLNQAEKLLDRHRLFTVPELCLLFRQTDLDAEERQRYIAWVHELARRKNHLEKRYNQYVLQYLTRPRSIKVDSIRKVWVRELSANFAEYSRVQTYLTDRFVQAMTDRGYAVSRTPYQPETFYPPYYPVHHLMEADPDLLLIVNDISTVSDVLGENFSKNLQVPKVSWFVDAPMAMFDALRKRGLGEGDILTSTDKHWFEDVQESCPGMADREVYYLPLAATYDEVGPVDEAWKCPVSYVGQIRDQSRIFQSSQLKKWIRNILDQIADALLRHRRLRPETLLQEAPELAELARKHDLKQFFQKFYIEIIWEANSRYKERTLMPLADLGLRVYGNDDWVVRTKGTPLEPCFTGKTVAHEDLPRLYLNSAINVNMHHLQSSTSLNLRVFDVPAAGGFLITDYMEGLEDLFEIDREIVVYRSPEELREKVQYYLDHPGERQEIAERARARVMKDHTFDNRWQTLLEIVRKEGWK